MSMSTILGKIILNPQEKADLESLIGQKILLRNTVSKNQSQLRELQELGKQNALIYLERNKLGQKLSIFEENNLFTSVVELQKKLGLKNLPRRIECYDISHLSGKFVYGSMVVFIDGRPAKKFYKLFKCKEQNDDFANHKEVLSRRLKRALESEILARDENSKTENPWRLPDLIIVDGGKGQLSSDYSVLQEYKARFLENNLPFSVEMCALAKREEELFLPFQENSVATAGQVRFLIQRIRDEAHRFAITNNRKARLKTARKSQLDEISGVGEVTKQKLLKTFGSIENILQTLITSPQMVTELVGDKITEKLKARFLDLPKEK